MSLRTKVLKAYKTLHRSRQIVFNNDERALSQSRILINEKFRENREVSDPAEIEKLLKLANDVNIELKTNVIQAVEKQPGIFQARITNETVRLDNVMFDENAVLETSNGKKCCGEKK